MHFCLTLLGKKQHSHFKAHELLYTGHCGFVYRMYKKFPGLFSNVFFFLLGSLSLISNNILLAITNDDTGITNRTIYFTVINPPKFGKLVNLQADKTTTEISSFTQQMVSVSDLFSHIIAMHIRVQGNEL